MAAELKAPLVPAGPTDTYDWGSMTWLLSTTDRSLMGMSAAKMALNAGARAGAHRHTNASETIIVDEGTVDIRTTILRVRVSAGEHHVIPQGQAHELINVGGDTAKLTILYSHPERDFHPTRWIDEKKARRANPAGQ